MSYRNIAFDTFGHGPLFVWAHGWRSTRTDLLPLAQSLSGIGRHIVLDLPGFGSSSLPPLSWGTHDYADALAAFLKDKGGRVIWVGHSFGGKVGLALAARHPDRVRGLVLIAASGLKRRRRLWVKIKIAAFKVAKRIYPWAAGKFFGSTDYRNAGSLRPIFVRIVNEDLSPTATTVRCPVLLLYGKKDSETPPEIGQRLSGLIPGAHLEILTGLDHYTILTTGRHIVATRIKTFLTSFVGRDDMLYSQTHLFSDKTRGATCTVGYTSDEATLSEDKRERL